MILPKINEVWVKKGTDFKVVIKSVGYDSGKFPYVEYIGYGTGHSSVAVDYVRGFLEKYEIGSINKMTIRKVEEIFEVLENMG